MPELWYAGSLNLSCIPNIDCASAPPPRPLHASPAAFLALLQLAAPVALVVWWLWRILRQPIPEEQFAGGGDDHLRQPIPEEQFAGGGDDHLRQPIPEEQFAGGGDDHLRQPIPEEQFAGGGDDHLRQQIPEEQFAGGGDDHLRPIPEEQFAGGGDDHLRPIPEEQPPRNRAVLDPHQVQAAAAAVRGALEDSIRPTLLRRGQPHGSADGYFRYPPIHYLEAVPQVRLLDAEFVEGVARGLPHAVEIIRQASIQPDDLICRLSDVANPSIFHGDPCVLATESTEMVIKMKIGTALICLIWQELNGQNQLLCQQVKQECFALVAGQSVEKLLDVAHSFSDGSWCACHVKEVLTIFDALVDVLHSVHGLPLNRSDEVPVILRKMVNALGGILDRTISDIDNSEESTVYPATVVFKQVLEFFGSNTNMVQSILSTGDLTIDPYSHMFCCWVSKLEEDAERICQGQEGQKHIILLNNAYDVWQMMSRPGVSFSNVELVSRLICMIQQCKKSYFDECWVPLIMPLLKEDHLKNPCRSSLDEFTQGFVSICWCHMTWKVLPGLRYGLREEIKNVVVQPYKAFVHALQANPSRFSELVYSLKRFMQRKKNQKEYTVEQLGNEIGELYES